MKKVIQKQILIDMMEQDEQLGLYQESLEKSAANLADPNLCKTDNWIAGAKWQQEQDKQEIKDLKDRLDFVSKSSEKVLQQINELKRNFPL